MTSVTVKVNEGLLHGCFYINKQNDVKYYSFQGIPYARPPLEELRFKDPLPPIPWRGVRNATKDGDQCYSRNQIGRKVSGSEDCLFLNVYTPEMPHQHSNTFEYDLRPVMVFVHGGAFLTGSNSKDIYGPDYLLREDVVLVTLNYRLGALGFLSLEDPTLEVPGNAALKDIVIALEWVQKNIRNFNGDPSNVTLFGESSGAVSVHHLMLSPLTKGLFHKVILQSGCALNNWGLVERFAGRLAKLSGISDKEERKILTKLQHIPVDKLHDAQEKLRNVLDTTIKISVGPVVELPDVQLPKVIPKHPLNTMKTGDYIKLPILMGYNDRDGLVLQKFPGNILTDMESYIPPDIRPPKGSELSKTIAGKIREFFFGLDEPTEDKVDEFNQLLTDYYFFKDISKTVKLHTEHSDQALYLYRMSAETELNRTKILGKYSCPGVCHSDDLTYIFANKTVPNVVPKSIEDVSIRRFCRLWANFARWGNPTPNIEDPLLKINWAPVARDERHFLDIGRELVIGKNADWERAKFWEELYGFAEEKLRDLNGNI